MHAYLPSNERRSHTHITHTFIHVGRRSIHSQALPFTHAVQVSGRLFVTLLLYCCCVRGLAHACVLFVRSRACSADACTPAPLPVHRYTADFNITPDMFWVMPRAHAEQALSQSLRLLADCRQGQACCRSAALTGRSKWMLQYWATHGGMRIESNGLLGSATLARNPTKGAQRACTLHVGCWRLGYKFPGTPE